MGSKFKSMNGAIRIGTQNYSQSGRLHIAEETLLASAHNGAKKMYKMKRILCATAATLLQTEHSPVEGKEAHVLIAFERVPYWKTIDHLPGFAVSAQVDVRVCEARCFVVQTR